MEKEYKGSELQFQSKSLERAKKIDGEQVVQRPVSVSGVLDKQAGIATWNLPIPFRRVILRGSLLIGESRRGHGGRKVGVRRPTPDTGALWKFYDVWLGLLLPFPSAFIIKYGC